MSESSGGTPPRKGAQQRGTPLPVGASPGNGEARAPFGQNRLGKRGEDAPLRDLGTGVRTGPGGGGERQQRVPTESGTHVGSPWASCQLCWTLGTDLWDRVRKQRQRPFALVDPGRSACSPSDLQTTQGPRPPPALRPSVVWAVLGSGRQRPKRTRRGRERSLQRAKGNPSPFQARWGRVRLVPLGVRILIKG